MGKLIVAGSGARGTGAAASRRSSPRLAPTVTDLLERGPPASSTAGPCSSRGWASSPMPTTSSSSAPWPPSWPTQWHLSTLQTSWVTGSAILGAFFGALIFGRIADVLGRKWVYVRVAVIMMVGALGSAFAPGFIWLVVARFVLGLGIGGDYPGLRRADERVLEPQGPGSPGRHGLLHAGAGPDRRAAGRRWCCCRRASSHGLTWRLMLGLGAIPAAGVIYLRSKMPESPRFKAQVQGKSDQAARRAGARSPTASSPSRRRAGAASKRMRLGAVPHQSAACSCSSSGRPGRGSSSTTPTTATPCRCPAILKEVDPTATLETKLVWTLGHLRGVRRPRLRAGRHDDGPDRAPPTAVHRVRRHGGVLLVLGRRRPPDRPWSCPSWPSSVSATSSSSSDPT